MTDRPTPETDAVWDDKSKNILEHARRLERERDELRESLELYKAANSDVKRIARERDEACKQLADERALVDALVDRLANAVACLSAETIQGYEHIQAAFKAWEEARK